MKNFLVTVKSLQKDENGKNLPDVVKLVPLEKVSQFVQEYVNQDAICIVAAEIEVYE